MRFIYSCSTNEKQQIFLICKSLLDSKLKDIQDSLVLSQYEMVSDNSSSIAYSNEQLHTNNFFNRVLNCFPNGWLLEVTTG